MAKKTLKKSKKIEATKPLMVMVQVRQVVSPVFHCQERAETHDAA